MSRGDFNQVTVIGNLAREPETKTTKTGAQVGVVVVAAGDSWTDAAGNHKEKTEFFRVAVYVEPLWRNLSPYLRKGGKIFVQRPLETRKYTDEMGQERSVSEIVIRSDRGSIMMLDSKPDSPQIEPDVTSYEEEMEPPVRRPPYRPTETRSFPHSIGSPERPKKHPVR